MPPAFRKVVVVDDDDFMRFSLSLILRDAGYEVVQCADGAEALELIEQDCPDYLITDWYMPGVSGVEVCQRLRAMDLPHYVHTILLTGNTDSAGVITGLEAGADDFIQKPVVRDELLARLRAAKRIRQLEHRLHVLARFDPLTEVFNRRTFFEHLEKEWKRSLRQGTPLSYLMLDVDYFKSVNDEHGHVAGDAVLREVAARVAVSCRHMGQIFRYGGEEFCILLPGVNEDAAYSFAEHCREKISFQPVSLPDVAVSVAATFGVAERTADMTVAEDLIKSADKALLFAKRNGRNRVAKASECLSQTEFEPKCLVKDRITWRAANEGRTSIPV